jgi:ribosomal protein S27AE
MASSPERRSLKRSFPRCAWCTYVTAEGLERLLCGKTGMIRVAATDLGPPSTHRVDPQQSGLPRGHPSSNFRSAALVVERPRDASEPDMQ